MVKDKYHEDSMDKKDIYDMHGRSRSGLAPEIVSLDRYVSGLELYFFPNWQIFASTRDFH